MIATDTKATTATATCSRMGCTHDADGQPWVFGMVICWACRLMLAGRRG